MIFLGKLTFQNLTLDIVWKNFKMALMLYKTSFRTGSPEASVATAFNLAFLSQLLQHCISCLEHPERYSTSQLTMAAQKLPPTVNGIKEEEGANCNGSFEDHIRLSKVQKIKKALKHRRRRRRQISGNYSFESESGSDFDGHDLDEDNDSDLSEGGIVDDLSEDELISEEDSEDVYVESESETEGEPHNSVPRTIFSAMRSGKGSLTGVDKLLNQQVANKQALDSSLLKQNGVVFNRVARMNQSSDVSDAETGKVFYELHLVFT